MKHYILFLMMVTFCSYAYLPNHPIGYVPPKKERPDSTPFISGDTFRNFCDYIFDETNQIIPTRMLKPGDTIFVNADILYKFFRIIHPYIPHPYILLTHNSDMSVPDYFAPYLDDSKIIAWFGMNGMIPNHPKFHSIPIGIENALFGKVECLKKSCEDIPPLETRSDKAYLNFRPNTNLLLRSFVWNIFVHKPFIYAAKDRAYEDYIADMKSSKFVICPAGYGIDCHRYWEALLLGCIPVMKHSTIDALFDDLPVILVDDWREVNAEFLQKKYNDLKHKTFNFDKLYAEYWLDKIRECKKNFLIHKG